MEKFEMKIKIEKDGMDKNDEAGDFKGAKLDVSKEDLTTKETDTILLKSERPELIIEFDDEPTCTGISKIDRTLTQEKKQSNESIFREQSSTVIKENLNLHDKHENKESQRPTGQLICNCCTAKFESIDSLQNHTKLFHLKAITQLSYHNAVTDNKLEKNSTGKPYRCNQCPKTFTRKEYLERHARSHLGLKPYPCNRCGKTFSRKEYLESHNRTHTGERPFRCSRCGKSFSQKGNLKLHFKIHTGEKRFRCNQCSWAFSRKECLVRHSKVHKGMDAFLCNRLDTY